MELSMEITCTSANNCAGIEIRQTSMQLRPGDKFLLSEGETIKLPNGSAVFRFPDGKEIKLTGPAVMSIGKTKDKPDESWGAFRWKLVLGRIWSIFADKPFEDGGGGTAVAGVRG